MAKGWTTKTATGIVNVHSRWTPGTMQRAGEILDELAIPGTSAWPSYRWPALVLDRGFAVGSRGGHGFVRYEVVDHEPGRMVGFAFDDSMPLIGGTDSRSPLTVRACNGRTRSLSRGRA